MSLNRFENETNGQQIQEEKLNRIKGILLELANNDLSFAMDFIKFLETVSVKVKRTIKFERCPNGDIDIRFLKPSNKPKDNQGNS